MTTFDQMKIEADRVIEISKPEDLQLLFPESPELTGSIDRDLKIKKFSSLILTDDKQKESKLLILFN